MNSKTFRFVELSLNNYGVFADFNELIFNPQHTLIVGPCGSGKTTIADALGSLGPKAGVCPHSNSKGLAMPVVVKIDGDPDYVNKYRDVIFINEETVNHFTNHEEVFATGIIEKKSLAAVKELACDIFRSFLSCRNDKADQYKEVSPSMMPCGERVCFVYAYVFAMRRFLELELPIVLDSPFGRLDEVLRASIRGFLEDQAFQQILLCNERELLKDDAPDYLLENINGGTRSRRLSLAR
jgi:ABC-type glutathione transport system ATPase component